MSAFIESEMYQVVVNEEDQYSIYLVSKKLPSGWRAAGKEGSKSECLDFIEKVWVDMRPRSLIKKMEG